MLQEIHGCVLSLSTVANDAWVLKPKHQAINIHGANQIFIELDQCQKTKTKKQYLQWTTLKNKNDFEKKMTRLLKG